MVTDSTGSVAPNRSNDGLIDQAWDPAVNDGIVAELVRYIAIPNVSVVFDPDWRAHGHMDDAVELVRAWCAARPIAGATVEVVEIDGLTPVVLVDIPAFGTEPDGDTVILYGHLDKQPEMTGWRDGLGPWTPVLEGDRLYGRGGADDGYAVFASLTAIEAVQRRGGSHAHCVVLIEASEESGSPDLPAYIERLADRLGTPSLVICLDSGCIDYDRMWVTTSLRGLVNIDVEVAIVTQGLHSGDASGIVPSTFRIARQLIERVEVGATGEVTLASAQVEIPADRRAEAVDTATEIGAVATEYPFVEGAGPVVDDATEQLLNRTWRAALSVVGADGLPPTEQAGNVLRPSTTLRLSMRIPPTADAAAVADELTRVLTDDVPYGARVTVTALSAANGWNAPPFEPWLATALDDASTAAFGAPSRMFGEGGSIPFMGMLGERFPAAQFVITGVLGPDSNAHGPNEYLHIPTARRLTHAMSQLLEAHAKRVVPGD